MPTLNLGRVGFVNKGAYIGGTTDYKINDVTTFSNGIYACIQAHNTPHVPTVGGDAYWQEWVTQDNSAFVADAINSATSKTTPVDADELPIADSSASFGLKKLTIANLKSSVASQPFRNRFINGDMAINQINGSTAVTVTAGAALNYVTDQWYAYCTGANVTTQRVAGSLQSQYRQQFTGAASVTKIGFAQRMEASFTYDMNGKSAMIGVDMSNSLLTSVTWTVWYANTADTFGTLASPTRTQIATGTITVSSTLGRYFIPVTIPSAATTGIEIEFSVGSQISGTWVIGNAQFEKVPTGATTGTDFEFLPNDINMLRCQRYLEKFLISRGGGASNKYAASSSASYFNSTNSFKVIKRVSPTIVHSTISYVNSSALTTIVTTDAVTTMVTTTAAGVYYASIDGSFAYAQL